MNDEKTECKYKPTERVWLYAMVWMIFLDSSGCIIKIKMEKMEAKLNTIEQKIDALNTRGDTNITHKAVIPLEK